MDLTKKILIALVAGAVIGLVLNLTGLMSANFIDVYLVDGVFAVVGKLFVNALKMLVVPLVIFSLIPGIIGIGDIRLLGRVGAKSFGLYLFTTAIAIATAIGAGVLFGIGKGVSIETDSAFTAREAPSFVDVVTSIIPSNPVMAMANGEMLAVIFFAVIFGVSLLAVAKEAPDIVSWIEQMNKVMMKMVTLVMHFAPYAVFCLMAKAVAQLGLDLLLNLIEYALVLALVLVFHATGTLMLLLKFIGGLSPIVFLKKVRTAQVFAFSTASSAATIPVTMRTVQERLGADRSVSSFTVPLGATINMDGTAMMQGVATVFIANIYGIDLGLFDYLTVIAMAVLASIGTAAVPGAGLIMLTLVFNQVGLPVEGIALILGIDRLLDMVRTAVNVTGDAAVSVIVANSEAKLDKERYADPHAGVLED